MIHLPRHFFAFRLIIFFTADAADAATRYARYVATYFMP